MKKHFIDHDFGPDATRLLNQIEQILERYAADGYDLSLRQLYYQLVAANIIQNSERSYKNIGNLVSDARLAGLIDWDIIKDRGREMVWPAHWESPAEIVGACAEQFRIDKWADQPNYVEVMVEKQALEGVLMPVCEELDVPFTANKGYSSSSSLYEAGRRMLKRALKHDRPVHVIYLGDHDPSGIDMSRDVRDRLRLFAETGESEINIHLHRIALNMDQVEELNPPENPAKITDSRAAGYIAKFGRSSWELDAIEPKRLASLVRKEVKKLMDPSKWKKSLREEDEMRAHLQKFADTYRA
jgi:hypothetical protein